MSDNEQSLEAKELFVEDIIKRIWQNSHFYGDRLSDCKRLKELDENFPALFMFFEISENIFRSIMDDYHSPLYKIFKRLYDENKISLDEYTFLNGTVEENKEGAFDCCYRVIRNKYMHDDLDAMALEINGVMHMFSEKDTAGILYDILFEKVLRIIHRLIS